MRKMIRKSCELNAHFFRRAKTTLVHPNRTQEEVKKEVLTKINLRPLIKPFSRVKKIAVNLTSKETFDLHRLVAKESANPR